MNGVAKALAQLLQDYYTEAQEAGTECRLLVPGLTVSIADDLHATLLARDLPSFLVVPGGGPAPSERERRLLADGLTRLRSGSMLIIAYPGQASKIQDSIVGESGGTVRSAAFSEEWPWIDDGSESFRFRGVFTERLLDAWEITDTASREQFAELLPSLVKASSQLADRGARVLERTLASFDPSQCTDIENKVEQFLRHAGLPRPAPGTKQSRDGIRAYLSQLDELASSVLDAVTEPGQRAQVLERAGELASDADTQRQLEAAIDAFFDGLRLAHRGQGILAFSSCWPSTAEATSHWRLLNCQALAELFAIPADEEIRLSFSSPGTILEPGKSTTTLAGKHGLVLAVRVTYANLDAAESHELVARLGRTELTRIALPGPGGECEHELDTASWPTTVKSQVVSFFLCKGGAVGRKPVHRLRAQLVSSRRPLLAVLVPGFKVAEPASLDGEDDAETIQSDEPTRVYVLRHEPQDAVEATVAGEALQLDKLDELGALLQSRTFVDPEQFPGGRCRIEVRQADSERAIRVDVEALDIERGCFSVEEELREKLVLGQRHRLGTLASIFEGKNPDDYPFLGHIDHRTRGRVAISRYMESADGGGPVLVVGRELPDLSGAAERVGTFHRIGHPSLDSKLGRPLGSSVSQALAAYDKARGNLLEIVTGGTPPRDRPVYAARPVFVETRQAELESALCDHLGAYQDVASLLNASMGDLGWHEVLALSAVDCVVRFDATTDEIPYLLLGPYHPLVVSRRFIVQSELLSGAKALLGGRKQFIHNRLYALLADLPVLRWFPGINPHATDLRHYYVASTDDPAWMLAASVASPHSLGRSANEVQRGLGLDAMLLTGSVSHSIRSFLRSYCEAFPSKRSLTVQLPTGYSAREVIGSAEAFLYDNGEPSEQGALLPGGIHLRLASVDDQEEALPWRTPPLCVYLPRDGHDTSPVDRDIELAPVSPSTRFETTTRDLVLARGTGHAAVAFCRSLELEEGAAGAPTVAVYESGEVEIAGNSIGATLRRALVSVDSLLPTRMRAVYVATFPARPESAWYVIRNSMVDPAALVARVRAREGEKTPPLTLWDYRLGLSDSSNTYFVLSRIPLGLATTLNGSPVLCGKSLANELLGELGEIGVAVGSEIMRTGLKALGVIGVVGAVRLMRGDQAAGIPSPLRNDHEHAGFVLPVDSFQDFLAGVSSAKEEISYKRADLLAVQLRVPSSAEDLLVSICAIECKYATATYPATDVQSALAQAAQTAHAAEVLVRSARESLAARLALLRMLEFGLRVSAGSRPDSHVLENRVYRAVLSGAVRYDSPRASTILVSTECGLSAAKVVVEDSWWVRLAPGHWPGVPAHESSELVGVRQQLLGLFSACHGKQDKSPAGPPVVVTAQEEVSTSTGPPPDQETTMPPVPPGDAAGQVVGPSEEIAMAEDPEGIRFDVGTSIEAYDDSEFYFHPSNTDLNQLNVGIVGDLGTGKTQLVKSLVHQLCHYPGQNRGKRPKFLVFDYKGDYTKEEFVTATQARIVRPRNIPLNLFDITGSDALNPRIDKANFFVDILGKIYGGIGAGHAPVQAFRLKQVIKDCYNFAEASGSQPTIYDVASQYAALGNAPDSTLSILTDMVDKSLFEQDLSKVQSFSAFFDGVTVLDLKALGPDDASKNMLVVVFLNLFYDYMLNIKKEPFVGTDPQLRAIDSFLLVDEADSIMKYEFPVLGNILLQGREFGVGVLLASQYLSHFDTSGMDYRQPLLTWFIHKVPNITKKDLSEIGLTGVSLDLVERIKTLGLHECLYKSLGVPGKFMRGKPFYELVKTGVTDK